MYPIKEKTKLGMVASFAASAAAAHSRGTVPALVVAYSALPCYYKRMASHNKGLDKVCF